MKLKLIIPLLIALLSTNIIAQTAFEKGKINYNKRAEKAVGIKAPLENINKALQNFKEAFNSTDKEEAIEYYLKSVYFKSTYCHDEGDKKRQEILEGGKKTASKMIEKYPNSAPIHYWYAVILGSWAKESGVFAAAKEGVIDKLKSECETVIKLDKDFDKGAAYLFLGILHLDAPYIPFFLTWPDDEKAIELMQKSLKLNPTHISSQYYLAKAFNEVGKKEKAILMLEKVLKQKPNPIMLLEETSELDLCKSLLNDLKK